MAAYLGWRDECDAVFVAYGRWADAARTDAASAFQAYGVALDREEHASRLYAVLIERARDLGARDSRRRAVAAGASS